MLPVVVHRARPVPVNVGDHPVLDAGVLVVLQCPHEAPAVQYLTIQPL